MDTKTDNKLLNTPLAKAVADLIWNWVDQPWGMQYDSGHCDSEMLAGDLKKILVEAHDDTDLSHGLAHYIAQRERYDADSRGISPVRQLLTQHGYEVSARADIKVEEAKPARRGWMGMFRR